MIVYNVRDGWFGAPLAEMGIHVLFSTPGIVLATTFISMPLVVREVVPVLEEQGTEQEQAARISGRRLQTTSGDHDARHQVGRYYGVVRLVLCAVNR